jgi:hypothetical protein
MTLKLTCQGPVARFYRLHSHDHTLVALFMDWQAKRRVCHSAWGPLLKARWSPPQLSIFRGYCLCRSARLFTHGLHQNFKRDKNGYRNVQQNL